MTNLCHFVLPSPKNHVNQHIFLLQFVVKGRSKFFQTSFVQLKLKLNGRTGIAFLSDMVEIIKLGQK